MLTCAANQNGSNIDDLLWKLELWNPLSLVGHVKISIFAAMLFVNNDGFWTRNLFDGQLWLNIIVKNVRTFVRSFVCLMFFKLNIKLKSNIQGLILATRVLPQFLCMLLVIAIPIWQYIYSFTAMGMQINDPICFTRKILSE